jgi:uncharacterized Fe-S cluster protein YjdI
MPWGFNYAVSCYEIVFIDSLDPSVKNIWLRKTKMCKYGGRCTRGEKCMFAHSQDEIIHPFFKSKECKFKENCRYGDNCKYRH